MILLIDAGNTRAKFAWLADRDARRVAAPTMLPYADLSGLGAKVPARPQRILGSNVAGAATARALEAACHALWQQPIEWCDASWGAALLRNAYAQPLQLGADRWVGMLGLLQRVEDSADWQAGVPHILATFGTATTVDTIARQAAGPAPCAAFLGGLILPGAGLMVKSLFSGTAQLPLAGGECHEFPTDTDSAIVSGIAAAQAGALVRQWHLAFEASGHTPRVFVAGGGWRAVRADVTRTLARAQGQHAASRVHPQWLDGPVLDGLACLARLGRADPP